MKKILIIILILILSISTIALARQVIETTNGSYTKLPRINDDEIFIYEDTVHNTIVYVYRGSIAVINNIEVPEETIE